MDYEMLLIYFLGSIALGCYDNYLKDLKIMRIDFRGQELMFIARDFFRRAKRTLRITLCTSSCLFVRLWFHVSNRSEILARFAEL